MGRVGTKQKDVSVQNSADGLKAGYLLLQRLGAFDQPRTSLEAVLACDRMVNEVGR